MIFLFSIIKMKKDVNIHKVTDIDENTVCTCILFSLDFYSDLSSYFCKEELDNNPVYEFYLLSELNKKDIEELKNTVFNNILNTEVY